MKRNPLAPILFLLCFFNSASAQTLDWVKQIGAAAIDGGTAVTVDATGNVYTTGYFNDSVDFDPGPGTYYLVTHSSAGFISKLDPLGNFLWAQQMTGSTFSGTSIVIVGGNLFITGDFYGTATFGTGTGALNVTSSGQSDIFICKMDTMGNFVWVKNMGGPGADGGQSIALDAFGNIYSTGIFEDTADFDPGIGTYNLTSVGSFDIFISKLDSAGNFLWAKQMDGTGDNFSRSIIIDVSGNIYVTGFFQETVDFDPGIGTYYLNSYGDRDIFISKLNASGNFLWAKQIGSTDYDYGSCVTVDDQGNIYSTGWFQLTADFDPGAGTFNLTSYGGRDIYISKLDSSGNFVWAKQLGGGSLDVGFSIVTDTLGYIYTAGIFGNTADFDPGLGTYNLTSAGGNEIFISKLDISGNFIWAKRMGGPLSDHCPSIFVDPSGNIYTTGNFGGTADFDPDTLANFNLTAWFYDYFISKLSNTSSGSNETEMEIFIKLYPNPTTGKLSIELRKNYNRIEIAVKNIIGQEMLTKNYSTANMIDLNIDQKPGIFFVEVKTDDERPVVFKVVKQ